jgi:3-hydroxybutyryl-CoA dehydratase
MHTEKMSEIFKTGDSFDVPFTVSGEVHSAFIQLFKDRNPLHTDEAFAVSKGFPQRVMHGNILNGFISYFVGECLPTKDVIIHSQEIQFTNAVYANEQLQFRAVVAGVYQDGKAVEFKFTFKNSSSKTVAKGKIQIGILQ